MGNEMRTLVSDMAGRASIQLKATELGVDLTGRDELVASVLAEVKELELRGYTFDAADASFELLLANALSGTHARLLRRRVVARHHRRPRRRAGRLRGHRQAGRQRPAVRRDGGGERPGQRPRPRPPAGARGGLPRDREARAHRLPRPHPRRLARHRRGHAGAHRDRRRRDLVEHPGGRGQHRRGVVAGARRRDHLRAAPARGTGSLTGMRGGRLAHTGPNSIGYSTYSASASSSFRW